MECHSKAEGLDVAICLFMFQGKELVKEDTPEALGMQAGAKVYTWAKGDDKAERRAKKMMLREP